MRFSKLIAVLMAGAMFSVAHAESIGTIGQTYPIGEESALTMIMNKLRQKERSGEMKKLQQQAIKRSLNSVKNMPPIEGLQAVTEKAQRLIDPTVYYPNAVKTDEGRIVVPAGAKINPLLVTSLSKRLVFFDGRDPEQAEAVRRMVKKEGPKVKPILVAGSWLDLTKAWKTQVYFDQKGVLSQRFGIHAVPSVISQQGASLLLQEVPAKELQ
jgi:conjugal transfer pilus assembly protein TraW